MPSIKVKQLYIKWNQNLDVSVKEININRHTNDSDSKIEPDIIAKYLKEISYFYTLFEKISINKITLNNIHASFKYEKGEDGYFNVTSPDFNLNSSLYFESSLLHIKIKEYTDNKRDIIASANIILNPHSKTLTSSIVLNIHDDISLNIFSFMNEKVFYYKVNSLKDIKSVNYLMEQLNLHKDLRYWAYEAIEFSTLSLHSIYGWINFNDFDNAYKNLYVSATGNDLRYAYNKNLDSIHTKTTDLEFKNGIFYIYPKQATTYKSKLGSSWLNIDFTKPEELLTLKLLFDGKLDKDTLTILEEFKIKVPFLQNTGKTKVDLTLKVNLQTIDVDAKGEFFTGVGNFTYRGHDIDVFNLKVELDNYDVRVNNMIAKYQDIINSKINVFYNAKSSEGKVELEITKFTLNAIDFKLNPKHLPLKATYTILSNNDSIILDKSYWRLKKHNLEIDKIMLALDLEKLQLNIPKTKIYSKDLGRAETSGYADLNKQRINLDFNLKDIYFGEIELKKKNNHIKIKYDKSLTITTKDTLDFKLNSEKSFLNPTQVEFKNNILILHDTYLNIGNLFKTKLYAQYNTKQHKGYLQTRRARFSTKELGELYFNGDAVKFDIITDKNNIMKITSKELEISLTDTEDMWSIDFSSLRLLSFRSKFLKKI
ncbi:MAG: hypothetical protein Q9M43_12535 [Sulfurimonas sp.]|nr:hypothetical protein [Sulfurimonas sp.]